MKTSLSIRLRAAIFSPAMLISVLLGLILLLKFHISNYIWYYIKYGAINFSDIGSTFLNEIFVTDATSGFGLFAPILAVLPATTLFCDDYNSGYIKPILSRIEKKRYIKETVFCSTIAGGLAVFVPTFLTDFLMVICFKPNTLENNLGYQTFLDEGIFANIQFIWGGLLVVFLLLLLSFLFGAVWSNIGLCISAFIPNKYVALATPFALYFSLHLILYKTGSLLLFSPVNMLTAFSDFLPCLPYPFIYQGILLTAATCIFWWGVKRRLKDV